MLLTWSKHETWDNVADEMFTFELKVRHQPSGKEMYLQLGDLPNVEPLLGEVRESSVAGNRVWTVWKRCEVSGTRPEVSEIQF